MQDFFSGGLRSQETHPKPEPYQLYRRDQNMQPELQRTIRDFEYFKSMYPQGAKKLQQYVEEVCDEMEYEGSPIYDEYPDRVLMEQMLLKIRRKAADWQNGEDINSGLQPESQRQQADTLESAEKLQMDNSLLWSERTESIIRSGQSAANEAEPEGFSEMGEEQADAEKRVLTEKAAVQEENSGISEIQELKEPCQESCVRVSYGPVRGECQGKAEGYQSWETAPVRMQESDEFGVRRGPRPPQGPWGPPSGPSRPPQGPWGPPSGPSRPPQGPWGPPSGPRPPQGPWGPPPGPRPPQGPQGPWGPSRPPQGPWGPPSGPSRPPQGPWGPPPRPWGPPSNRPGGQNFFGDLLSVLLFNELQGRRCRSGRCW